SIEPRLNQVFAPILAIATDEKTKADLLELARAYHRDLLVDRSQESEAKVLEVIRDLRAAGEALTLKEIVSWFTERHADEYERKITPKWVGWIVRKRLHLQTVRRNGGFGIADEELASLPILFDRYGVTPPAEAGTASTQEETPVAPLSDQSP